MDQRPCVWRAPVKTLSQTQANLQIHADEGNSGKSSSSSGKPEVGQGASNRNFPTMHSAKRTEETVCGMAEDLCYVVP